jgi:hypothetical protein
MELSEDYKAGIKGYSLTRDRIPRYAKLIDNATLVQVQVQEVRGRIVYYFEIDAQVPVKD